MDNHTQSERFRYTYSAKEQEELRKIRQKYLPKEADKMEQLRQLDQSVTRKATMTAIVIGIEGTLILGVGMCCCMVWASFRAKDRTTGNRIEQLERASPSWIWSSSVPRADNRPG